MFKKAFIILLACIICVAFCACSGGGDEESKITVDPNDPFTGEWVYSTTDGIYEFLVFNGDGRGNQQHLDIVTDIGYTYDDSKLYFDVYVDNPPIKRTYEYKIDGNDLFLKNVDTGVEKHYVKETD